MYADEWDEANFPQYPQYGNGELWERLINGDCSRVVILSPHSGRSMLELYFPQTLGLPPLRQSRFHSSRPDELEAEATGLAAADRWIAEGEVWARYFLPRAEAIISVETTRVAAMARPARTKPLDVEAAVLWVRRTRAKRRRGTSDQSPISALDLAIAPPPLVSSGVMKPLSLAVAEEDYPDKLIRVSTRMQVRALRNVRTHDH